ncbi:MAG: hypothetical protein WBQ34_11780 [Candidatus Acidiferrales bacterium]
MPAPSPAASAPAADLDDVVIPNPVAAAGEWRWGITQSRRSPRSLLHRPQRVSSRRVLRQLPHSPQLSDKGPDISSIEFQTPYEQVAAHARDAGDDYFAPDAAQDYLANPIHEVIVHVLIFDTPTFFFPASNDASAEDAARTFKFHISQDSRELESSKITAEGTETLGLGSGGSGSEPGIDIHLHVDVSQFKSSNPVTIQITAPSNQTYSTTFDLAALK